MKCWNISNCTDSVCMFGYLSMVLSRAPSPTPGVFVGISSIADDASKMAA